MNNPGAYRVYLIFSAVSAALFATAYTVASVYRVESADLSPLQLVLVGTTLEVTYFLCNVPTGVVADTYSRRLSVLIGVGLWGIGLIIEGSFPVFSAILLAQVAGGIGYTFVEGALEAWLTDEIGEEQLGRALLRGGQIGGIAGFVGIWVSVGLASIELFIPLIVAGVGFVALAVMLIPIMHETAFQPPERATAEGWVARTKRSYNEMASTTRLAATVVRGRPLALTVLAVAAIYGGFSEGLDRLWEAHFLTTIGLPRIGSFDQVVWFGIIAAVSTLIGIGAAEVLRRRVNLEHPTSAIRALFGLEAVLMGAVILFALAGNFAIAVGAFWIASVARGLVSPVYSAWINRGVDPQARATVLSMSGQADALGQFTVGPAIGGVGSLFGLRSALTVAGLALAPAVLLYGRAIGRSAQISEQTEDSGEALRQES